MQKTHKPTSFVLFTLLIFLARITQAGDSLLEPSFDVTPPLTSGNSAQSDESDNELMDTTRVPPLPLECMSNDCYEHVFHKATTPEKFSAILEETEPKKVFETFVAVDCHCKGDFSAPKLQLLMQKKLQLEEGLGLQEEAAFLKEICAPSSWINQWAQDATTVEQFYKESFYGASMPILGTGKMGRNHTAAQGHFDPDTFLSKLANSTMLHPLTHVENEQVQRMGFVWLPALYNKDTRSCLEDLLSISVDSEPAMLHQLAAKAKTAPQNIQEAIKQQKLSRFRALFAAYRACLPADADWSAIEQQFVSEGDAIPADPAFLKLYEAVYTSKKHHTTLAHGKRQKLTQCLLTLAEKDSTRATKSLLAVLSSYSSNDESDIEEDYAEIIQAINENNRKKAISLVCSDHFIFLEQQDTARIDKTLTEVSTLSKTSLYAQLIQKMRVKVLSLITHHSSNGTLQRMTESSIQSAAESLCRIDKSLQGHKQALDFLWRAFRELDIRVTKQNWESSKRILKKIPWIASLSEEDQKKVLVYKGNDESEQSAPETQTPSKIAVFRQKYANHVNPPVMNENTGAPLNSFEESF